MDRNRTGTVDTDVTSGAHNALARSLAVRAGVLLKNAGGLLPLRAPGYVAVLGPAASSAPITGGGGSGAVTPKYVSTVADAVTRANPGRTTVSDTTNAAQAAQTAAAADLAVVVLAATSHEGADRTTLALPQADLAAAVAHAQVRNQNQEKEKKEKKKKRRQTKDEGDDGQLGCDDRPEHKQVYKNSKLRNHRLDIFPIYIKMVSFLFYFFFSFLFFFRWNRNARWLWWSRRGRFLRQDGEKAPQPSCTWGCPGRRRATPLPTCCSTATRPNSKTRRRQQ